MPKTIEISHKTILFTIGIILGGWVLLQIRDILYLLFLSFILMTGMRPVVDWVMKWKVPRVFAILLVYVLFIIFIGGVVGSMIPTIAIQSTRLVQEFPSITARVMPSLNLDFQALTQSVAPITQNVVRLGLLVFGNIVTIVTVLVFSFYFLLGRTSLRLTLTNFVGEDNAGEILEVIHAIEMRIGAWVRGEIILMVTIGLFTYIGLVLLRVDYALPLAVFAGFLEIVPMVGPIISAVPAVLLALTISPLLALSVAALYFVIQQFENHIVVPFVMKKSVGFSPILTIVAIMIGGRFEGIVGAILAVPAILAAQVIAQHLLDLQDHKGTKTS